ncbi:hypothetical protein LINPERHAP1_LOCUS18441 [Linum perenne]
MPFTIFKVRREPLQDVTNVRAGTKGKAVTTRTPRPTGPQLALVDVPVVYDNPTFRGDKQSTEIGSVKKRVNKREKVVTRRDKPSASNKSVRNDGKQIRSFIPRKGSPSGDPSQGAKIKDGDPPDRS